MTNYNTMEKEEEMNNWKQFQGTELGSLMSSIYGNQNRPKINYPKPKTKPMTKEQMEKGFHYAGSKPGASDPRKVTRTNVKVNVPKKFQGKRSHNIVETLEERDNSFGMIDIVPKRRQAERIKEELDDIAMRNSSYRPAHRPGYSTDVEKDKFSQICTFKGGKGLPKELTLPKGLAPYELADKKKEEASRNAVRNHRYGIKEAAPMSQPRKQVDYKEQFAEQILGEIDDRRNHLEEMRTLGISDAKTEKRIKSEISQKMHELKAYE